MRKKLIFLTVIMALMVLAACSSKEPEKAKEDDSTAKDDAVEMRTIDTVMGEVEVPVDPQRVVVDWDLGQVLALGVEPIGASTTTLEYGQLLKPFVTDRTEDIGRDGQTSYEKVLELKPDLIITWDREQLDKFEKIAPTVVYETKSYTTVEEQITAMGEILNKQAEAKAWNEDYDKRIAAAKKKIEDAVPAGSTFTIIDAGTVKAAMVIGDKGERGGSAAYKALELTPQENVKKEILDKGESRVDVSWEGIGDYIGDYIFLVTPSEEDGGVEMPQTWETLEPVKNGHIVQLDIKKYFTGDPISVLLQAEDMAEQVANLKK